MGVGSRTFFLLFLCVGLGADVFFLFWLFSACVGSCGNSMEKSWRSSNGRGRTIMWRFVNRSLYLSEGGEFVSRFSSSQFPFSLHSHHHFDLPFSLQLFVSPSPHTLSFSWLINHVYQRRPLRIIPRREPHRRLVRCMSHFREPPALLSRPEEGGGIRGFRVCGIGGVGVWALNIML